MAGAADPLDGDKAMKTIILSLFLLFMGCPIGNCLAYYINLNDFTAFPQTAIQIDPNEGRSALFSEDSQHSPVSLQNETLMLPAAGGTLSFEYELTIPADNSDFFDLFIADPSQRIFEMGGSANFDCQGDFTFDYTHLAGTTVPLYFHLISDWSANDPGLGSQLIIRNLQINPVPLPGTFLLLVSGILGLWGIKRKKLQE